MDLLAAKRHVCRAFLSCSPVLCTAAASMAPLTLTVRSVNVSGAIALQGSSPQASI